MGTLATVLSVLDLLAKFGPVIAQGVTDLEPFAMSLFNKFSGGKEPTEAEREAIRAKLKSLHDEFQQPMPPTPED